MSKDAFIKKYVVAKNSIQLVNVSLEVQTIHKGEFQFSEDIKLELAEEFCHDI